MSALRGWPGTPPGPVCVLRRLPTTVMQLLPALESGGVERSTLEISRALVQAGYHSLVVSAGGRLQAELEAHGGIHICLPIGQKSLHVLWQIRTLRQVMTQERPDIVHARSRLPAWIGWHALQGLPQTHRPRWMTTVHGLNSPSRYSAIMASGERVICVSNSVREHVLGYYSRIDPARLRVIPRGIDPAAFAWRPRPEVGARRALATREPCLGGSGPLLLLPGRGTRLKGHMDAMRLLARLRADGLDARLWMPGAREPGRARYLRELEHEALHLGVANVLAMTPPTATIADAYAASDLVLQLSRKPEAFGRTVIEALSVGRPVLGWAHGGAGELLHELFPEGAVYPFDDEALVARAYALIHRGLSAPVPIPYTLERMQADTLALYDNLLRQTATKP